MKRKLLFALMTTFVLGMIMLMPRAVLADTITPVHVMISSVQTADGASTYDDYIKLYNPTSSDVNMTGWKLQYRTASKTGADG
ncbi:MAG TPA: lamin tail domain-containing protein, partial [Candidatus Acidoferrum sp.]|nr:lamin tail domain-containing protein [Candidatus Acidoferrum sp.]